MDTDFGQTFDVMFDLAMRHGHRYWDDFDGVDQVMEFRGESAAEALGRAKHIEDIIAEHDAIEGRVEYVEPVPEDEWPEWTDTPRHRVRVVVAPSQ